LPPLPQEGGRAFGVALALIVALIGLALFSGARNVWTIDPDAAAYVGLSRSLLDDGTYALQGSAHTKYPPGLPWLLAGLAAFFGTEAYAVFHLTLVACLLAVVVLSACIVRRLGYPPAVALAVAAAVGLSQTFFDLTLVYLRTEVLFTALSLAALALLWRAVSPSTVPAGAPSANPGRGRLGVAAAAAVFAAGAVATRLAGITLAAAVLPWLWRARGRAPGTVWRVLPLALACLLVLVAWQWRSAGIAARTASDADYGRELSASEPRDLTKVVRVDNPPLDAAGLVRRATTNLDVFARACAVLLTNVDRAGARRPVGLALMAVVLLGLVRMCRSPRASTLRRSAALYVLGTLALYLVWPFNQQQRFYVPLLPLLLLAAGEGLVFLLDLARAAWTRPAGRLTVRIVALSLPLLAATQRSDYPTIAGRWSQSYAALLGLLTLAGLATLAVKSIPRPRAAAAWLLPACFVLPFAQQRWVEWPAVVSGFEARRAAEPQTGRLARIDVDPRLEQVAIHLVEHTPPETVLMTDVPKMMHELTGRRCVPFVYRREPPEVLIGAADLVFYTGEIPEAAAVLDAVAQGWHPVLQLDPVDDGVRSVVPTVWRPR